MFQNVNNVAYINGDKGIYDGKINNSSVRYGRNAVNNNLEYLAKYSLNCPEFPNLSGLSSVGDDEFNKSVEEMDKVLSIWDEQIKNAAPIKFEYKYLPGKVDYKNLDKMALLGAAFEELGKKVSIGVNEFTNKLQEVFGSKVNAKALDLNKDNQIDISEYATSILVADMLSTDTETLEAKNINGVINNEGQNNSLPYINEKNYEIASETFGSIHQAFNLNEAQKEFLKDPNNIIQ